jgi:Tfp pilus assembly protein PilF
MRAALTRASLSVSLSVLLIAGAVAQLPGGGGTKPGNQPPAKPGSQPPGKPGTLDRPTVPDKPGVGDKPGAEKPGANITPPGGIKDENVDRAIDLFKNGKVADAYEALKEAAKQRPELPPARLMLARMFAESNQPQFARFTIEQAASENPDHPDIYISLGNIALTESRFTDAMLQFEKGLAVGLAGKWPDHQKRNIRLACANGLAQVAESRGKWETAREHLKTILELEPKNGQVRYRLGRVLFMLDDREGAANEMEKAEADDKRVEPAGVAMGKLYTAKNTTTADAAEVKRNLAKAEEWMKYAVEKEERKPKAERNVERNVQSRLGYAIWLVDQGRVDDASVQIEEATKIDDKSADVRFFRGFIARRKKDFPTAERMFEGLVQESPANFNASNQLALVLIEEPEEAKRRRALEIAEVNAKANSQNAEALATLGWVYYKLNRLDDAERYLQGAAQANRGQINADTAFYLAHVLADRGKLDEVKNLLKRAVDAPGRFNYRKEAEAWLEQLNRGGR